MSPETRSAAEAFDALRAEVRETHTDIRGLTTRILGVPKPDYTEMRSSATLTIDVSKRTTT